MVFKNPSFLFSLFTIFTLLLLFLTTTTTTTTTTPKSTHYHHRRRTNNNTTESPPKFQSPASDGGATPLAAGGQNDQANMIKTEKLFEKAPVPLGGQWVLLQQSIGISAMHMQLLHTNKVVIFDRTDFGPSNLSLPLGVPCRQNDAVMKPDCTAHSLLYDVITNSFRPLTVHTDTWCSSGALDPSGALVQTGGYKAGDNKIRQFTPCLDFSCDWVELPVNLSSRRWYSSDHILPDGRIIVFGGRNAFSYEFYPKNPVINNSAPDFFKFPFLQETNDPYEENNLYPFLHLLPDGNLFVFANQRSILLDYKNNKILREYPAIPGAKRTYPSTGSSVLLPMRLTVCEKGVLDSPAAEVLVCGGSEGGHFLKAKKGDFLPAANSCGRLRVTAEDPQWVMEEMPSPRVMPDMLLLPTGDVILINGAANGTAGWEYAENPVFSPFLYVPTETDMVKRFTVLNPTTRPRLYHSSAVLLPDGRILVGGSNPHEKYNFTGVRYPTELSLESFSPPYLAPELSQFRPSILSMEGPTGEILSYGQMFSINVVVGLSSPDFGLTVTMVAPSFTTHSFAMNQRMVVLPNVGGVQQLSVFAYKVTVQAPPTPSMAPPGYYMLFVVHEGVPGQCLWVKMVK